MRVLEGERNAQCNADADLLPGLASKERPHVIDRGCVPGGLVLGAAARQDDAQQSGSRQARPRFSGEVAHGFRERASANALHRQERARMSAVLVDPHDVRVIEAADGVYLALEAMERLIDQCELPGARS